MARGEANERRWLVEWLVEERVSKVVRAATWAQARQTFVDRWLPDPGIASHDRRIRCTRVR